MKNSARLLAVALISLLSCTERNVEFRQNFSPDYGCTEMLYTPLTHHAISEDQLTQANSLLAKASIPVSNLRFISVIDENLDPVSPVNRIHIKAQQYANNLPIFGSDVIFHFVDGNLDQTTSKLYDVSKLPTDTTQYFSTPFVRGLFMEEVRSRKGDATAYASQCLELQFGFIDLDASKQNQNTGNFKKAWIAYPKESIYPTATFLDSDGLTYGYYDILKDP